MDYLYFQELYHHGIKGQKWGYRKYQNEDGSLTDLGRKRYGYNETDGSMSKLGKERYNLDQKAIRGQRLSEKGKTIGSVFRNAQRRETAMSIASIASFGLATKIAKDYSDYGVNGATANPGTKALVAGLLATSGALFIGQNVEHISANNKIRDLKAYEYNGKKDYISINGKK